MTSSVVTLLPTIEFLDAIARQQWATDADYIIAFSTVPPRFFSTTNSEWVCLNSESELLGSKFGSAAIQTDFSYTRPESSPVLVASSSLKIPPRTAQSIFLYRSNGETEEIIFNANYTRDGRNQTTAPLLDCFSRECASWFSSDVDWFTGFGSLPGSLSELVVGSDGVILTSSEDILSGLIPESTQAIAYTSIQFNPPATDSPFVRIEFASSVEYLKTETTPDFNVLFLYNSDSLVAFGANIESEGSFNALSLKTNISFNRQDTIIF